MKWMRMRFHANEDDFRCVNWPPPGPYWLSAQGNNFAVVVAFIPISSTTKEEDGVEEAARIVRENWPEATEIETSGRQWTDAPTFSDRFACPEWWDATNARFCGAIELTGCQSIVRTDA